jgi:hypothetical protein
MFIVVLCPRARGISPGGNCLNSLYITKKLAMSPFNPTSSVIRGIALTFVSLLFAGCGGGGIEKLPLYPASGTVQMDGKPFGPVSLRFEPETAGGRGFVATVDATGKIDAVTTYKVGDGAPVGTFKVTVFSSMGASKQFPAKYENAKTTPLKVIIADITGEGANAMDIQLDSKAGAASKLTPMGHFTPEQLDAASAGVEN